MLPLPSGPATLLFTDFDPMFRPEDFSELQIRLALAQHDRLLSKIIQEENGFILKKTDGAFRTVFSDPPAALRAAVRLQLALLDLGRNGGAYEAAQRVRAALHTGRLAGSGAYTQSPLISQTEAYLAMGRASQILLSNSAREAVGDALPLNVSLRDLGLYGMKDMLTPKRVWQICHPGLPSQFTEYRAVTTPTTNLPFQTRAFIGRKRELMEIKRMLGMSRLVTLTGAEGIGKTRLALEVGQQLVNAFPDGVWHISLAALSDATHIFQAVARMFGLREKQGGSLHEALITYLKSKRLLLLCDHYNILTAACSEFADTLLRDCPQIHILATGYGKLKTAEARSYQVSALVLPPLPDSSGNHTPPYALVRYESIRLFLDRARLRQPHLSLSPTGAEALCRLCRRLNGAPLALELAAARVGGLTIEQIAAHLANYFLMHNGVRTVVPCLQPLQIVLDWTYVLLGLKEKHLLLRLSVFPGSWSFEAAEAICANSEDRYDPDTNAKIGQNEIQACLTELVENSLVICFEQDGQPRYVLPDAIRIYALKRLEQTKEGAWVRDSHCSYFFEMAKEAYPRLTGCGRHDWLKRLEREYDNIRIALEEALDSAIPPLRPHSLRASERRLLFVGSLEPFWRLRGYFMDGRHYLGAALAFPGAQEPVQAHIFALNAAASLARAQHETKKAEAFYHECLTISYNREDKKGIAAALDNLALTARDQGDYTKATSLLEQAIAFNCQSHYRNGEASNRNQLGSLLWVKGDFETALVQFGEALLLQRGLRHDRLIAKATTSMGNAALDRGEFKTARNYLTEGLSLSKRLGDYGISTTALLALAKLVCLEGKREWSAILFAAAQQSRHSTEEDAPSADEGDQKKMEAWLLARLDKVNYPRIMHESNALTIDQILARLHPPSLRLVEGGNPDALPVAQEANLT